MLPPLRTIIEMPVKDLAEKLDYEKYSFLKIITSLCNNNRSILNFVDNYSSMENSHVENTKVQKVTSQADFINNIVTSDKGSENFNILRNYFFKNNANFSLENYFAKN